MTAANITTVVGTLGTSEVDLAGTTVPVGEDWKVSLRLTNKTTSSVTVRISTGDGTNYAYETFDYTLGGNQSIDVLKNEPLTPGFRLKGRAGIAASVDYRFSGMRRLAA